MNRLGQFGPAVRLLVVLTVVLGLAYPLTMTGIANVVFGRQADGSLVTASRSEEVVGSSLIGQSFGGDPEYFQSRPSAAGDGYDPSASGASNLALDSADLLELVRERQLAVAELDGVEPGRVPPDAVLASGSGLDPHISPGYAEEQVARVADARGLRADIVRQLVAEHTLGRTLGFLGAARVNVLELNLALDELSKESS